MRACTWLLALSLCTFASIPRQRSQAKISSAGAGGVSVCMPGCECDGHQPVLAIGQWRVYFSYGGASALAVVFHVAVVTVYNQFTS